MKTYVWLTFAFMGWGYYEMSGGAEFVPEDQLTAAVEVEGDAPEIVARANTTTLMSISTSNVTPQTDVNVVDAVANTTALDTAEVVEVAAPILARDIREVAGSRVNMRMGPGTGFDVITTLESGTKLEVLSVDAAGWANVSIIDSGTNGWMAERLLTDADI
ncbi:MAG: SH3 domain-containing protein [Octadecabacter sp.]